MLEVDGAPGTGEGVEQRIPWPLAIASARRRRRRRLSRITLGIFLGSGGGTTTAPGGGTTTAPPTALLPPGGGGRLTPYPDQAVTARGRRSVAPLALLDHQLAEGLEVAPVALDRAPVDPGLAGEVGHRRPAAGLLVVVAIGDRQEQQQVGPAGLGVLPHVGQRPEAHRPGPGEFGPAGSPAVTGRCNVRICCPSYALGRRGRAPGSPRPPSGARPLARLHTLLTRYYSAGAPLDRRAGGGWCDEVVRLRRRYSGGERRASDRARRQNCLADGMTSSSSWAAWAGVSESQVTPTWAIRASTSSCQRFGRPM